MTRVELETPNSKKQNLAQKAFMKLNTYRTGFTSGILMTTLLATGAAHLVFNVYRAGSMTLGDFNFGRRPTEIGQIGEADRASRATDGVKMDLTQPVQTESNSPERQLSSADRSLLSDQTYDSNSKLVGFAPEQGYQQAPAEIGDFSQAMPIAEVGLGQRNASFEPRSVFIGKRKYQSNFFLKPDQFEVTRVGFDLEPASGSKAEAQGLFLQFGLGDLDAGTTPLTYLVSIFGDGVLLWSSSVRYEEAQIAAVVLDVENYSDIVIEYQVTEAGDVSLEQNPLYFTAAKRLFQ